MTRTHSRRRNRRCGHLRPYHCQLDANQALLDLAQQGKRRTTYTCEHCGLIHLTNEGDDG